MSCGTTVSSSEYCGNSERQGPSDLSSVVVLVDGCWTGVNQSVSAAIASRLCLSLSVTGSFLQKGASRVARSCLIWSSTYGPDPLLPRRPAGIPTPSRFLVPTPLATTDALRECPGPDGRWL